MVDLKMRRPIPLLLKQGSHPFHHPSPFLTKKKQHNKKNKRNFHNNNNTIMMMRYRKTSSSSNTASSTATCILVPLLIIFTNALVFTTYMDSHHHKKRVDAHHNDHPDIMIMHTEKKSKDEEEKPSSELLLLLHHHDHDEGWWREITQPNKEEENALTAMEECDRDFGFGLIRHWNASRKLWCSPTISCYPYYQTGHGGYGDNLCVITNVTLDPSPFNDNTTTRPIMQACVESNGGAYLEHVKPMLYTSCQRVTEEWNENQLPGWNKNWMQDALATDPTTCEGFDEIPTLLIERNGLFANLFHQTEAFFNAFLALLITGLHPGHVRILIADLYPLGPFESLWRHLFREVLTAWDIKNDAPR